MARTTLAQRLHGPADRARQRTSLLFARAAREGRLEPWHVLLVASRAACATLGARGHARRRGSLVRSRCARGPRSLRGVPLGRAGWRGTARRLAVALVQHSPWRTCGFALRLVLGCVVCPAAVEGAGKLWQRSFEAEAHALGQHDDFWPRGLHVSGRGDGASDMTHSAVPDVPPACWQLPAAAYAPCGLPRALRYAFAPRPPRPPRPACPAASWARARLARACGARGGLAWPQRAGSASASPPPPQAQTQDSTAS